MNVIAVLMISMMIMREQKKRITFFLVLMDREHNLPSWGMLGCSGITDSSILRLTHTY